MVIESSKVDCPRRSEIKLVDAFQPVDVHIATQKNNVENQGNMRSTKDHMTSTTE